MTERVVVTGAGAISPLGNDWCTVEARLRSRHSAIVWMDEWAVYDGLATRLAAPAEMDVPAHYTRKQTRSMGRVALLAVRAAEIALEHAGLIASDVLTAGRTGVAFGSSAGSADAAMDFVGMRLDKTTQGLNATSYLRMMSHTAAVNIGMFFGLTGRVLTTTSACTAGSQGIGYAFEAIRHGLQDVMIAGGAEELCPMQAAVFDTLLATSTRNDAPRETPRPFDVDRDGLVVGEGAGALVLESLCHARARGATPIAEVVGYGTNADGAHPTRPNATTQAQCLRLALASAGVAADAIGYVNAHGTATRAGDVSEAAATAAVLGNRVPIASLKSYMGHTLGACGALEAWLTIEMMNAGWYAPNINLDRLDPECAELDYITGTGRCLDAAYAMSNNFAFGGINTSLIFARCD